MREILTGLLLLVMLAFNSGTGEVADKSAVVKVNKIQLAQGEVLSVTVEGTSDKPEGSFLGEELRFQPYQDNWIVFAGISYWTEPGEYPLKITLSEGRTVTQTIIVTKGEFKESRLTVSEEQQKIVQPTHADEKIIQRKERDQALISEAYSHNETPPLWSEPFIQPAKGRITTGYGYTRYVNGKLNNRHSGLDIANVVGTPIYATNKGIVRLATELLSTGNTTIIDHGGGVYSSYSHQSEILVKPGDVVQRGQLIGKMGSTGFSTGSHLHWVIKIGDNYLNPTSFIGIDLFHSPVVQIP